MLPKVSGVVWTEEDGGSGEDDVDVVSWSRDHGAAGGAQGGGGGLELGEGKDELGLATFKSMLEDDWYLAAATAGSSGQGGAGQQASAHQGFDDDPLQEAHHQHYQAPGIQPVTFYADGFPPQNVLLQAPVDSSSSCSPSSVFPSQTFFAQKSALTSLLSAVCSNPFDAAAFNLGCDSSGFLAGDSQTTYSSRGLLNKGGSSVEPDGAAGGGALCFGALSPRGPMIVPPDLSHTAEFQNSRLMPLQDSAVAAAASFSPTMAFGVFDTDPFLNRSKVLRPLETFTPVGAQPTLFQKRAAALRQNSSMGDHGAMALSEESAGLEGFVGQEIIAGAASHGTVAMKGTIEEDDAVDEASNNDRSGLNYVDSDEVAAGTAVTLEDAGMKAGAGKGSSNASTIAGGGGSEKKGKKKGLPAKNLMAERRRRKKLNDRLYMLRSVVPKISKMDRASILSDAIEYLKELLQRINDLHNELESTTSGASSLSAAAATSFQPLTPPAPTLPCRVKEELCPSSSMPSPSSHLPRVEVREREGGAVNIHMFCARRPGLLLSTMRALDGLGLDIQQAVISCFNGFALDVFRAEQCRDGPGADRADDIKAVLLHSAGSCHGPL